MPDDVIFSLSNVSKTFPGVKALQNISIDFRKGEVEVYMADGDKWIMYHQPLNYDINLIFVDELSYFMLCIKNKQNTFNDVREAAKTLQFALAIKQSSIINKSVSIGN